MISFLRLVLSCPLDLVCVADVSLDHLLFTEISCSRSFSCVVCRMNDSFDSVKELHTVGGGVSSTDGVDRVQRFNRFHHIDLSAKWVIGPVSQRFIRAQNLWAELKLWNVFDKISSVGSELRHRLVTFEVRLPCS